MHFLVIFPLFLSSLSAHPNPLSSDRSNDDSDSRIISDIETMIDQDAPRWPSSIAPVRELEGNQPLSNALDKTVMESMNITNVDKLLWEKIKTAKEEERKLFELGSERNTTLNYAVRATYVCPFTYTGYKLMWRYSLVEKKHHDWEKMVKGDEHSCNFTLSIKDIRVQRMRVGKEDEEIDLKRVNDYFNSHSATVNIARGDDLPAITNLEVENPTFMASPIILDQSFAFPTIIKTFSQLTNLSYSVRVTSLCDQLKAQNLSFYRDLCPTNDFYGGQRSFYGKSRSFEHKETAVNMYSLLQELLPAKMSICDDHWLEEGNVEVAPARLWKQDQTFVQTQDIPSIFAIDVLKVRSNYQRFYINDLETHFVNESESRMTEPEFSRHLDQTDLIMNRLSGGDVNEHITEADKDRIKKNKIEDCKDDDNKDFFRYLADSWWAKILLLFVPSYNLPDCQ